MPYSPAKPCRAQGCPNKVKGRAYCPKHQHLSTSQFRNKKGGAHPWYQKKIWKSLRKRQLSAQPLCEDCTDSGRITPATVVDHIQEWKEGKNKKEQWELFTDTKNHQSLCTSCHNSKTARSNK